MRFMETMRRALRLTLEQDAVCQRETIVSSWSAGGPGRNVAPGSDFTQFGNMEGSYAAITGFSIGATSTMTVPTSMLVELFGALTGTVKRLNPSASMNN